VRAREPVAPAREPVALAREVVPPLWELVVPLRELVLRARVPVVPLRELVLRARVPVVPLREVDLVVPCVADPVVPCAWVADLADPFLPRARWAISVPTPMAAATGHSINPATASAPSPP
jgi:hypothetical protein